jgi:hypothetical protein
MRAILEQAGRAALRVIAAGLLAIAIQVTGTHSLHDAAVLAIPALIALIASVLTVFGKYVPEITFDHYIPKPFGAMLDAFFHAGVGTLIVGLSGWLQKGSLSGWHAILLAIIIGALNAGLRAVEGAFTKGQSPFAASGIPGPGV